MGLARCVGLPVRFLVEHTLARDDVPQIHEVLKHGVGDQQIVFGACSREMYALSVDYSNNRELRERFRKLEALYNLKTCNAQIPIIIQVSGIQAYKKHTKINIFIQSMAKTHAHKITRTCAHARTHTHTHIGSRARTMPIKRTRTRARSHVEATYSPSMHVNTKRVRHE